MASNTKSSMNRLNLFQRGNKKSPQLLFFAGLLCVCDVDDSGFEPLTSTVSM